MNRNQRLLQSAGLLRPIQVRNYAESRKWEPVSGIRGRMWVFRHSQDRLRQVQVPMDADAPGFADAMLIMASRFAELEGREVDEVLADLQHPDADVLRFRMVSPEAQGGQLPLAEDISLREGARRALLAAASSVVSPTLHHPRLSRSQAEQLVRSCLAGQTERGSYVHKIVCPLNAVDEPQTLFDSAPFVRRTTRLLMEATAELVASIESDKIEQFLERDRPAPKVSWNLCDALLRMRPAVGGKVQLSVNWASAPSLPPPVGVPDAVSLPEEYFPELERAASALRPTPATAQAELLIGTVESLDGVVGEDGRRAGEVTLRVFTEEGDAFNARVSLTADQYQMADEAHMQGHGYVWVRGILRRGSRVGRIERIEEFDRIRPGRSDTAAQAPA